VTGDRPDEEKKLEHVYIWKKDRDEADRLFGDSTSHARRFNAILDVIKRERLVEKVRRQVLGGLEAVYLVSSEEEDTGEVPPIGGGGV